MKTIQNILILVVFFTLIIVFIKMDKNSNETICPEFTYYVEETDLCVPFRNYEQYHVYMMTEE